MHKVTKDTPCTMIQSVTAHPVVKQVYIKDLRPKVCIKRWGYNRKVEDEWFYVQILHGQGTLTGTRRENPDIKLSRLSYSHRLHTLLRVMGIHPPPQGCIAVDWTYLNFACKIGGWMWKKASKTSKVFSNICRVGIEDKHFFRLMCGFHLTHHVCLFWL